MHGIEILPYFFFVKIIKWGGDVRNDFLLLTILATVILLFCKYSFAKDNEYDEAKKIILKVFNGTHIINSNKYKIQYSLSFENCNIYYSFTIDGNITESQSCNINDLNSERVEGGNGSINIWTVNEERKVNVSSLKNKYWMLTLNYDPDRYSDNKIMVSLKKVLGKCNEEEGVSDNGTSQDMEERKNIHEISKFVAPNGIQTRQAFASIYNRNLTGQGLAHSVFSAGEDHSTLLINKIKMSEKLINGITRDQTFLSKLREIGFNKIKFCEPSIHDESNCQTFSLK